MLNSFLKHQQKGLLKALQAYENAANAAAMVSITDLEGTILFVNEKFIEISQYNAEELIGKTHRVVNSGEHPPEFFKKLWDTIQAGKVWRGEVKNKTKSGDYYWVDTVIAPVFDNKNKVFQYLSIRNLITAQKEYEEQLLRSQQELIKRKEQLKEAQRVAKTGSWYLSIPENLLAWSEEAFHIFGIPIGTDMTYDKFLQQVHPDDREMVEANWQAALKGADYEIEHRIITPQGEKWVSERAQLQFNHASELTGAVGTVQDITEKKKNADILKESESLYKNLFNNSPFANLLINKKTLQILEVNEKCLQLYQYTKEEFLQLTAYDIRVTEEHEQLRELIANEDFTNDRSIRSHKKKNGEIILVEPYISEVIYKGNPALLIIINDVTEKLKLQQQLIGAKMKRQHEISKAAIEAQEKNSSRIGRELHDNVNQLLVVARLYLRNVHPSSDEEQQLLDKSIQATAKAIEDIRDLCSSLVPPSLIDFGLRESIEDLSESLQLNGANVENNILIDETILPDELKICIYRIAQEQFSNIIKYAHAKKVLIEMKQDATTLTLAITDNGKGFDTKQKANGIGLNNIVHRAESYNGKVQLISSEGNGCRLLIEFDL